MLSTIILTTTTTTTATTATITSVRRHDVDYCFYCNNNDEYEYY